MVKWSGFEPLSRAGENHHVRPTQSRSATVTLGRRGLRAADGQGLLTLMCGAILATGRRTISNLLRHPRVGSRPSLQLSPRLLAAPLVVVALGPRLGRSHPAPLGPRGLRVVAGDDTVDEHRGARVYGKGRHRDPVRSTHSYTAYRWGHKWVVLAILVRFPFANRPWALPVLVALYRSREWNQQHRRRHRTPAQLLRRLVAVLLHWFPHRHFTLTGDGGYGSHEMARFAHRHRRRLTLVSRFVPDAQLYTPPPVIAGKRPAHRPRTKGEKLPTPEATVAATGPADRTACNVSWYGGGRHDIEVVTATGNWYHSGEGLVPFAGSSSAIGPGRIAMITSSAPIRRWPRPRWSRRTPVVGRLRPPSKKCVLTWDWRRREDGRRRPYSAGALPVWVVLGGRGVVRPVAGARAGRGPGGMAGQGRDDLLRCHHGGKALAVGELGFCKPWVRRRPFQNSHARSRRPCFQPWAPPA